MKKTMIALAVAAAMPVAAQADVTLSGDASVKFAIGNTGSNMAPTVDTNFKAASSEVLTNGMTATASFNVLSGEADNATVGLSGDFGSVTAGSAEASDATTGGADESAVSMKGVSYSGSFAGLSVAVAAGQYNAAGKDSNGASFASGANYNTVSASYDFNGLTVGAKNVNDVAVTTASYAFGDLTVSAKQKTGTTTFAAAYAATLGDLGVTASANTANEWDVALTYSMSDIAITAKDSEAAGGATLGASYSANGLTVAVDSDSKVTVDYDMGNADINLTRDSGSTTVKYIVSF